MASLADWLFSGNLLEFPKLKLAYSEGQIGWIPYVLERADTVWEMHDAWTHAKERIPVPPSTLVLRPDLRLLHRRPPRPALARRGGRGQHLLRDRLPAHRHDVAALGGLHREAAAPTSTTTSPTRSCGATPSGCWSSTASEQAGCSGFRPSARRGGSKGRDEHAQVVFGLGVRFTKRQRARRSVAPAPRPRAPASIVRVDVDLAGVALVARRFATTCNRRASRRSPRCDRASSRSMFELARVVAPRDPPRARSGTAGRRRAR